MDLETVILSNISQKEKKQISCINTYMWNLEKMYRWTHLQSRDRDTDKENKCVDAKGGWGTRMNREGGIDMYTDTTYRTDN